jgi:hypothetical protein
MEQTLTKQNFFGKDPIQWWLGIVTDPTKGKWDKTLKVQKSEDGKEVYYYRVRVRILGYHDNDQELPDEQLPFAQVLGPANQSLGIGGEGDLLGLQGGETVLGFFMDGEDGQQPVIFGTLYRNRFVQDAAANKKTAFEPFTPPETVKGKHTIDDGTKKGQPWSGGVSDNESSAEITVSKLDFNTITDILITPPDPCEKNGLGRVTTILEQFINKISQWKQFAGTFYDPLLGKIIDIRNELTTISSELFAQFTEWTRKLREDIIASSYRGMAELLKTIPKPSHPFFGQGFKLITDQIFCLFEKTIGKTFNYIFDSLKNFIGKVADFSAGIVDSFLGNFLGQMSSILQTGLNAISQFIDLGINVADTMQNTLGGVLGFVTNLFSCDDVGCRQPQAWSSRFGTLDLPRDSKDNFSKVFKTKNFKEKSDPSSSEKIKITVEQFTFVNDFIVESGNYDGVYVKVPKLYYLNVADNVIREGTKNDRGTDAYYNKFQKTGIVFDSESSWYIVTGVELINGTDLNPKSTLKTQWGLAQTQGFEHPNTAIDVSYGKVVINTSDSESQEFSSAYNTDIVDNPTDSVTYTVSPPKVIFGGRSKNPAKGVAMVNKSGQVVGISLIDSGRYLRPLSDPPLITFYDKSRNGFGAGAVAVMGPVTKTANGTYKPSKTGKFVGVVGVAMISNGKGYADRTSKFVIGA